MKKIVSIIAIILTVCMMISITLVPAFAIRDKEGKLPLATSTIATLHNSAPQISATTINETNSATYVIIAAGIFVVAMSLGILIGYNIKKKKNTAVSDESK